MIFFRFNLLIFLLLLPSSASSETICLEKERQALLSFKEGLKDDDNILSSWKTDDCCAWKGVQCNNHTSHVIALNLSTAYDQILSGKIGPSLVELQHLIYLDLSNIDFSGSSIPGFIGSLSKLEYLNLTYTGLVGVIPDQLGNLSSLQTLDLRDNDKLTVRNLKWLSHLSSLRYLDLTWVNLSETYDWSQAENKLPFIGSLSKLEYLNLASTSLFGVIPDQLGNLSNLQTLDLRNNYDLTVRNLKWLSHLSSLRYLDLSSVNLSEAYDWSQVVNKLTFLTELKLVSCGLPQTTSSSFPSFNSSSMFISVLDLSRNYLGIQLSRHSEFFNYSSLTSIDLGDTGLFGPIPEDFGKLKSLESLNLYVNELEGGIANSIENLTSLRSLDLSVNRLNGPIPLSFGRLPKLESLNLGLNQFQGTLPDFSPSLPLSTLILNDNELGGTLPESMGNLSELVLLDFSSNHFTGLVSEVHLQSLSKLEYFDFSYNSLVMKFSSDWIPPFNLTWIRLRNIKTGPHFPSWLQSQKLLMLIDISGSGINDTIPSWFWNFASELWNFNLSNNYIHGMLPDLSLKLNTCRLIDLSSNNMEGPIPQLPASLQYLSLNKNRFQGSINSLCNINGLLSLSIVDLSNNLLSGSLPDCWMKFIRLEFLRLANNKFSGPIPSSVGQLRGLQSLHLRNNSLEGELPSALQQCKELSAIDIANNKFTGKLPAWLGRSFPNLVILSLRSNQFNGSIPSEICYLKMIRILDLSVNNFSGKIPKCLRNFTTMAVKGSSNLTINREYYKGHGSYLYEHYYEEVVLLLWKGLELEYGNTLGLVKSIDLSSNYLTGEIPSEITYLEGLVALNLSRNDLTGKIPIYIGHLNQLEFLDLSRNLLSGKIPSSLSQLNYIGLLDLSNNNLSGKIPSSTQLQSFNASAYSGNPGLFGPPLSHLCPEDKGKFVPSGITDNIEIQKDEKFLNSGFYISMGIGFAVGLWGTLCPILLNSSWRVAYFRFVTNVEDSVFVIIVVNMGKLKRWLRS